MTEENKTNTPEATKTFKWIPARDGTVLEIYSNFMHASWTLFDVRVRLGELISLPPDDTNVIEERGNVTFSWPQAKYMAGILSQLVKSFEDVNGEIKPLKLPPDPTVPKAGENK